MNNNALVLYPIIVLACLAITFSVTQTLDQVALADSQEKTFCPFPDFSLSLSNSTQGVYYECYAVDDDPNPPSIVFAQNPRNYDATLFDFIPYGWLFFIGDTLTAFAIKGGAFFTWVGAFIIPIAQIQAIPFLALPYGLLFLMMGIGIYGKVRKG